MTPPETWASIRSDYEAGNLTVRKIAEKYGKSHPVIVSKAKKDGWSKTPPQTKPKPKKPKKAQTKPQIKKPRHEPFGRPTKFGEAVKEKIAFFARKGFTDAEISKSIDIEEQTLTNWKKKYPDFFGALMDWKAQADEKVERSLYERACGYEHPETKAQWVSDESGGRWEYAELVKRYPPETPAITLWLKNRKPAEWRDNFDHTINGGVIILTGIPDPQKEE